MKKNWFRKLSLLLGICAPLSVAAQGTAFTYQGRLTDNAAPANGAYDLRFYLRDALAGGNPVGPTNTIAPVNVTNGLFTVTLDFGGGIFSGPPRWLEIGVRTNGSASGYTALAPRQNLTPSPYAITAGNLVGPVAESSLPASVPRIDQVWLMGGNSGLSPATDFLGTTDNQPFEIRVNGGRALRLVPSVNEAPSVLAGSALNTLGSGVQGAVVAGGGGTNSQGIFPNSVLANFATIGGGIGNTINVGSHYSAIAGGGLNVIEDLSQTATIGGGGNNRISLLNSSATIAGGSANSIFRDAVSSTISGGAGNIISNEARRATIAGGINHLIESADSTISGGSRNRVGFGSGGSNIGGGTENSIDNISARSVIGGGVRNAIQAESDLSTIAGGRENNIGTMSWAAAIGGGTLNTIGSAAQSSAIAGGESNRIENNAEQSAIGGGWLNVIAGGAESSVIGGGRNNLATGPLATVPGGRMNVANELSFAAGHHARATSVGSFVWADSRDDPFETTGRDQFLIRAQGGVGIGTASPLFLLEVNGTAGKPGGGSWSVASDARLKKNIQQLGGVLDQLLQLRGVSFEYTDPERIHELHGERIGLLAQEVEKVFPDWVEPGRDGFKRLTVRGFEALTIEALRELRSEKDAKIAALEKQLEAQSKINSDWESRFSAMQKNMEQLLEVTRRDQ